MEPSQAKLEIKQSIKLTTFCMKCIGLTFEQISADVKAYRRQKLLFMITFCCVMYHVFADIVFLTLAFANSPRIEDVVPYFHPFGYGFIAVNKVFVLWLKKDVFAKLIEELSEIWPVPPLHEKIQNLKEKSLHALKITQNWIFHTTVAADWFFNLTPIFLYYYHQWQGQDVEMGFVWVGWYPFDKHQPIAHACVYIFEIFAGLSIVWIMLASDLLFTGMASHITLLLKILQYRIKSLNPAGKSEYECYNDITTNIKLHRRLIKYCNDIEAAFSFVNLISIVMSSVNICCVCFSILLLEPLVKVHNKLFLASALIQMGVLCWYADEIFHANDGIAHAAYNCQWYTMTPRCRRSMHLLILRSQKPLAFTAMGFTKISLVTYASILTRSYSYFALLYQMYNENN